MLPLIIAEMLNSPTGLPIAASGIDSSMPVVTAAAAVWSVARVPPVTPPQGNIGGDGAGGFNGTVGQINLNNFAGEQFFVVPEPASVVLVALAGVTLLRRRA